MVFAEPGRPFRASRDLLNVAQVLKERVEVFRSFGLDGQLVADDPGANGEAVRILIQSAEPSPPQLHAVVELLRQAAEEAWM